jgi:hypothetical protein
MTEFISIPLIIGIITFGIYRLFELFVRRKERLIMIEKMGATIDPSILQQKFSFPETSGKAFGTLKIACLLLGVGLGLLIGFFILMVSIPLLNSTNEWYIQETSGIIYGASVLLFGGVGLLVAFLLEQKYSREDKRNSDFQNS